MSIPQVATPAQEIPTPKIQHVAVAEAIVVPKIEVVTIKKEWTREELVDLAIEKSKKYKINEKDFLATIKCESNFSPSAIGDQGNSRGIVQIHGPSHPNISKSQAFDPEWALDWAAKQFSLGKANMWTCYRLLGSM